MLPALLILLIVSGSNPNVIFLSLADTVTPSVPIILKFWVPSNDTSAFPPSTAVAPVAVPFVAVSIANFPVPDTAFESPSFSFHLAASILVASFLA